MLEAPPILGAGGTQPTIAGWAQASSTGWGAEAQAGWAPHHGGQERAAADLQQASRTLTFANWKAPVLTTSVQFWPCRGGGGASGGRGGGGEAGGSAIPAGVGAKKKSSEPPPPQSCFASPAPLLA